MERSGCIRHRGRFQRPILRVSMAHCRCRFHLLRACGAKGGGRLGSRNSLCRSLSVMYRGCSKLSECGVARVESNISRVKGIVGCYVVDPSDS